MPYTAQQPPTTTVEWAQISKTAFSLPSIMPLNSKPISNSKEYYKTELAPINGRPKALFRMATKAN